MRDGDTGIPRKIELEILGDSENFFELEVFGHSSDGVLSASLVSLNLKFLKLFFVKFIFLFNIAANCPVFQSFQINFVRELSQDSNQGSQRV